MSTWLVHSSDETSCREIIADSVSLAGSILAFIKHGSIAAPDGKIQGIPIAFVDLASPNVGVVEIDVEMDVQSEGDAKVVAIV